MIYLYVRRAKWFFMLDIYGKDEKDDLTAGEKRELSKLANEFKRQVQEAVSRRKRRRK